MIYVASKVSRAEDVAFSGCWIMTASLEEATVRSKLLLSDSGWQLEEVLEAYPIDLSHYNSGDEGIDFYNQAMADGQCCAIFLSKFK